MTSDKPTGRAIGGKARMAKLTPDERKAISAKMVEAKKAKAGLPKATHNGKLKIGNIELDVAVLDNDSRILSATSVFEAFDRPRRANSRLEIDGIKIPAFMDAKNLEPFINQDTMKWIRPVEYSSGNQTKTGYNAALLPAMCSVYLSARRAGVLTQSQEKLAVKSEILLDAFAQVGIIALVDEATGYQEKREKDALAKIFEAFVAKELQPWVKTFPTDYYKELCRLYGVKYPPLKNNQFPQFFGHVTNDAVYTRLAPEILPELKKAASKQEKKAKLHQFLTNDVGHPKLREHLSSIITILKLSKDKEDFKRMLNIAHPKLNHTMDIDF